MRLSYTQSVPLALLCCLGSALAGPSSAKRIAAAETGAAAAPKASGATTPDAVRPSLRQTALMAQTKKATGGSTLPSGLVPLVRQRYAWPYSGPNHVDTYTGGRGPQTVGAL